MRAFLKTEELFSICENAGVTEVFSDDKFNIVLEEDSVASRVVIKADGQNWFTYKLRDREFDGPQWWMPTKLTDWKYRHPVDIFNFGPAVEQSRYWCNPEKPLNTVFSEDEADFIINPFSQLPFEEPTKENLQVWLMKWKEVVDNPLVPFPGQFSLENIPGLTRCIFEETKRLLKKKGYKYITSVPTWLHVATLNTHFGFEYMYPEDKQRVGAILDRLPHAKMEERKRASWITVLQFWAELAEKQGINPESLVDGELILRDDAGKILTYPLTPERNLWQIHKL